MYKTEVIPNDQNQSTNFRINGYNSRGGYNGRGRYKGLGGYNSQSQYQNNYTRRPRCWICHKENHLSADCPYKERIDLKFCNTCGVGDHSLEDCPIMLEKIINKKIVNSLFFVPKSNVQCAKNLQVITRYGRRIGLDKNTTKPIKHIEKNDYPNCQTQKELFKDGESF
jgi:hypothetical protein